MSQHIIVVKHTNGELGVYFTSFHTLEEEQKEYEQNGEMIVASYPLEDSLSALGILVSDSLNPKFENSFGNQVEILLTKMIRDVYKMKESVLVNKVEERGRLKPFLHRGNWP